MNETLDLPLFDLCDAHLSALRGGFDVDIGYWTVDHVADACVMTSRAGG